MDLQCCFCKKNLHTVKQVYIAGPSLNNCIAVFCSKQCSKDYRYREAAKVFGNAFQEGLK